MKFIISPAKTMKYKQIDVASTTPVFLNQAKQINSVLKLKSTDELKKIFKTSDKLTLLIKKDIDSFLKVNFPVISLLDGLQYKNIDYQTFSINEKDYFNKNVLILSGLYGILRPTDNISPYRLDFKDNLGDFKTFDLYKEQVDKTFFRDLIYINLSSKEYSEIIKKSVNLIDIVFAENIDGKLKMKSTFAKIARGRFLRFVTSKKVSSLEELKEFDEGYIYSTKYSTDNKVVFLKK